MAHFDAVGREHVVRALEEYDELGAEEFLERYRFGRAREYVLWREGKSYDSKAILGVAHRYATGALASASEFSGGKDGAVKVLRALGFEVTAGDSATSSRSTRPSGTRPEKQASQCPTCHTTLPTTGICGYCA